MDDATNLDGSDKSQMSQTSPPAQQEKLEESKEEGSKEPEEQKKKGFQFPSIPSSSAHATLAMPILAPLADFAKLPRSIVVTAYQSASGLLNLITPTSVIIMGALAVARTGYDRWFRFVWPLLLFIMVATMLLLSLGAFGLGVK